MLQKKAKRKQKEILILSFIPDRVSVTPSKTAFNILHVRYFSVDFFPFGITFFL